MNRQILAPVDRKEEVEVLLRAGADWLYGGGLPGEWLRRYPSIVPLNQRTFAGAQFPSLEDLGEAISLTRDRGGRFALVLNAPFYTSDQMPLALDLARFARKRGAEAVIAGDPGLLSELGRSGTGLALHLSTMGLATNLSAVRLFRSLGVTRIILPRFLSTEEVAAMARSSPGMEFESFILVGNCPNVEGVCSFLHDSADQQWPCEWSYEPLCSAGSPLAPATRTALSGVPTAQRRDACGLCALPRLARANVTAFKIVGRGTPMERKRTLVEILASALRRVEEGDLADWPRWCRAAYRTLFRHPCSVRSCYYPEVREG